MEVCWGFMRYFEMNCKNILFFLTIFPVANLCLAATNLYSETESRLNPNTGLKVMNFHHNNDENSPVKNIILFKTDFAVNTDGSPISYSSIDLEGKSGAINNVCNAIQVFKYNKNINLCRYPTENKEERLKYKNEAILAFEQLMKNNWVKPKGSPYDITYENVLSLKKENSGGESKQIPCIFKENKSFKGYFGSETALKNKLKLKESGECGYKNQVDSVLIPGFVLPKLKSNPLNYFGAIPGDLIYVFDPLRNTSSFAIVNDIGGEDNSGEGSVRLLMNLRNKIEIPRSYSDSKQLAIHNKNINSKPFVMIFIGSKNYKMDLPYTEEKIKLRGRQIIRDAGFQSEEELKEFMREKYSSN